MLLLSRRLAFFLSFVAIANLTNGIKLEGRTDETGVEWFGPFRSCRTNGDSHLLDECLRLITKDLTPRFARGMPEFDIPPLEPMIIKKINYKRVSGRNLNLFFTADDAKLEHLTEYKVMNYVSDTEKGIVKFKYEAPHILVETDYKLDGKIWFFPIRGDGPARFDLYNVKADGEFIGNLTKNVDGEEVYTISKTDMKNLSIQSANVKINGLFNGNPFLGRAANMIGTIYAPQIFDNFSKDFLADYVGNLLKDDLMNPVLRQLPYVTEHIPDKTKERLRSGFKPTTF